MMVTERLAKEGQVHVRDVKMGKEALKELMVHIPNINTTCI